MDLDLIWIITLGVGPEQNRILVDIEHHLGQTILWYYSHIGDKKRGVADKKDLKLWDKFWNKTVVHISTNLHVILNLLILFLFSRCWIFKKILYTGTTIYLIFKENVLAVVRRIQSGSHFYMLCFDITIFWYHNNLISQ